MTQAKTRAAQQNQRNYTIKKKSVIMNQRENVLSWVKHGEEPNRKKNTEKKKRRMKTNWMLRLQYNSMEINRKEEEKLKQ